MILRQDENQQRYNMHRTLLLTLFVCWACTGMGQEAQPKPPLPLTIGYLGHMGFQPGIKLGTELRIHTCPGESSSKNQIQALLLSPQVAVFTVPGNSYTGMLNAELLYRRQGSERKWYVAPSVGLAYLSEWTQVSTSVSLSDGSKRGTRVRAGFVLPNLGLSMGKDVSDAWGYYTKANLGQRLHSANASTTMLFLEGGFKFYL